MTDTFYQDEVKKLQARESKDFEKYFTHGQACTAGECRCNYGVAYEHFMRSVEITAAEYGQALRNRMAKKLDELTGFTPYSSDVTGKMMDFLRETDA